jgi:hypothetical protein
MLSFLYRLLLGVWLGALLCFGAVVAPALFKVLAPGQAGSVVRQVIPVLDLYGLIAGVVLVAVSLAYEGRPRGKSAVRLGLLAAMVIAVAISAFYVSPTMESLRESVGGEMSKLAPGDPVRRQFGALHGVSSVLMALELVLGLVALGLGPPELA